MSAPSFRACLIIIGNEILSGRTQDKNIQWIARELVDIGVALAEVRVIPDVQQLIINTVNTCRAAFDYVFTTGGIGPTHDDITSASIAKAFGVELLVHPEARARLEKHYAPDALNEARLKMAYVPKGASLIENPVSGAPGFKMENVYVMAGVPSIMQAMFGFIKPTLQGGPKMLSRTITGYTTEGLIGTELAAIQDRHMQVEIGSYPFIKPGKLGVSIVLRGVDAQILERAAAEVRQLLGRFSEVTEE